MIGPQRIIRKMRKELLAKRDLDRALQIFHRYSEYTMIPAMKFASNALLCEKKGITEGCIVECGVWRGGMSAGIADILPGRTHYLFDSFEGLPPATNLDGPGATEFQRDVHSVFYRDNLRAERSFAERAMNLSAAKESFLVPGWFEDTVANVAFPTPIAVLRLDGDWYESTMQCLSGLYSKVSPGGLIIIDDYYDWEGCARAVHDFLSAHKLIDRLRQTEQEVCYFIKS